MPERRLAYMRRLVIDYEALVVKFPLNRCFQDALVAARRELDILSGTC